MTLQDGRPRGLGAGLGARLALKVERGHSALQTYVDGRRVLWNKMLYKEIEGMSAAATGLYLICFVSQWEGHLLKWWPGKA